MSPLHILASWAEGLVRIVIGIGLCWIGVVEGAGYGVFLGVVGGLFLVAGLGEIWLVEAAAVHQRWAKRAPMNTIHPALVECDIPVFYATTEGQTRRIAERLVAIFREKGFTSRALDVASSNADYVDWPHVRAALVGASLHAHRHQRAAAAFVREHADDLNIHPSAFFSVSLATASANPAERDEAAQIASKFAERSRWRPNEIVCIAGRLAYTQYGFVTRLIMKRIARSHGMLTDASRDYELTSADDITRLADAVVRLIAAKPRQAA